MLDREIESCLKEGFQVIFRNEGSGVEAVCRTGGDRTYSASAQGKSGDLLDALKRARETLKKQLTKR